MVVNPCRYDGNLFQEVSVWGNGGGGGSNILGFTAEGFVARNYSAAFIRDLLQFIQDPHRDTLRHS